MSDLINDPKETPPPTNEASLGIINEDTASSSTQDEPAPIATEQTPYSNRI